MKLIGAAFAKDGWNYRCCACGHYSSITDLNRYTRAWPEVLLARNVHPSLPFRFLKRWPNEDCVLLRPQTFITRNIRAERCTMRSPRFRVAQTYCYFAET